MTAAYGADGDFWLHFLFFFNSYQKYPSIDTLITQIWFKGKMNWKFLKKKKSCLFVCLYQSAKKLRFNDGDLFLFESLEMFVLRPFDKIASLVRKR